MDKSISGSNINDCNIIMNLNIIIIKKVKQV